MTRWVAAIVLAGVAFVVLGALGSGVDSVTAVILVLLVGFGALGIAISRRFAAGAVRPAVCGACGGVNSPNAPYCKHCGAPSERDPGSPPS